MCGTTEASGITSGMSSTSTIPTTVNSSCCCTTSPAKKNTRRPPIISGPSSTIIPGQKKGASGTRRSIPGRFGSMDCTWASPSTPNTRNGPGRIRYSTTSPVNSSTSNAIPATQKQVCSTTVGTKAKNRNGPIRKPVVRPISGAGPWAGTAWPWWMCWIISPRIIPDEIRSSAYSIVSRKPSPRCRM